MSFYDDYKPFRDYLGQFELIPSLIDIWSYSKHIIEGGALPGGYAVGLIDPKSANSKNMSMHGTWISWREKLYSTLAGAALTASNGGTI